MIWMRIECDMPDCESYLDNIPEGERVVEFSRRWGWTTRRLGDGYVRHVCVECKDRPMDELR